MTLKRFITYLFTYENGTKGKNAGFIRVNERGGLLGLEIHIQGLGGCRGRAQAYLLAGSEGIPVGEFSVSQGRGTGRFSYEFGGGEEILSVSGVAVRIGAQCYVASSWADETPDELATGNFTVRGEEKSEDPVPEEDTAGPDAVEPEPEHEGFDVETENAAAQPVQEPLLSGASAGETRRIDISDIRTLPPKNRYLCNNSFVIHGFFHYHYLIVAEFEEDGRKKTYLGVPGIYERPERMMAMLFGFPEFRTEAAVNGAQEEKAGEPVGAFGYWLSLLDT